MVTGFEPDAKYIREVGRIIKESVTSGTFVSTTRVLVLLEDALKKEKDPQDAEALKRLIENIDKLGVMGISPYEAKEYWDIYSNRYLKPVKPS
jgi:hypothetical protein